MTVFKIYLIPALFIYPDNKNIHSQTLSMRKGKASQGLCAGAGSIQQEQCRAGIPLHLIPGTSSDQYILKLSLSLSLPTADNPQELLSEEENTRKRFAGNSSKRLFSHEISAERQYSARYMSPKREQIFCRESALCPFTQVCSAPPERTLPYGPFNRTLSAKHQSHKKGERRLPPLKCGFTEVEQACRLSRESGFTPPGSQSDKC